MEVLDIIKKRRTVRKYLEVPVEKEKIALLLEAAQAAPSSGNLQNWKFIVVTDHDIKEKISEACLEQFWMSNAPVHIVVVAEMANVKRFYGLRGERLYGIQNCAAAIQNILVMASALDLGTAWVGAFEENMLCDAVGIIGEVRPQAVITVGYADEKVPVPPQKSLEQICYLQNWGNRLENPEDLIGHFSPKINRLVEKGKKLLKK
ncbi:nitroreductase family protein [Candidatus Woesearchaeota archaeon]|nr:nitroreductase family protein [Candidatus Woesearchaeota archaeon]